MIREAMQVLPNYRMEKEAVKLFGLIPLPTWLTYRLCFITPKGKRLDLQRFTLKLRRKFGKTLNDKIKTPYS